MRDTSGADPHTASTTRHTPEKEHAMRDTSWG